MSQRTIEVTCDVEIEQTQEFFYAHAIPDGIEIRPGDRVIVHDAPTVAFGGQVQCRCRATVIRANPAQRLLAHVRGWFELTELYEVGFDAKAVS